MIKRFISHTLFSILVATSITSQPLQAMKRKLDAPENDANGRSLKRQALSINIGDNQEKSSIETFYDWYNMLIWGNCYDSNEVADNPWAQREAEASQECLNQRHAELTNLIDRIGNLHLPTLDNSFIKKFEAQLEGDWKTACKNYGASRILLQESKSVKEYDGLFYEVLNDHSLSTMLVDTLTKILQEIDGNLNFPDAKNTAELGMRIFSLKVQLSREAELSNFKEDVLKSMIRVLPIVIPSAALSAFTIVHFFQTYSQFIDILSSYSL